MARRCCRFDPQVLQNQTCYQKFQSLIVSDWILLSKRHFPSPSLLMLTLIHHLSDPLYLHGELLSQHRSNLASLENSSLVWGWWSFSITTATIAIATKALIATSQEILEISHYWTGQKMRRTLLDRYCVALRTFVLLSETLQFAYWLITMMSPILLPSQHCFILFL